MSSATEDEADEVATSSLLANAAGVRRQAFPKTYTVRLTWGFYGYLVIVTVMIFGYTAAVAWYSGGVFTLAEFGFVVLFDTAYVAFILSFIFCQVPRTVIRENDRLVFAFCCRKRSVPISSIVEIRIVKRRKFKRGDCFQCHRGLLCKYPTKCFWGYPTNFDRNIIVVSDTSCNNYLFSLIEMEDFVADNWPERDDDTVLAPEPEVLGNAV